MATTDMDVKTAEAALAALDELIERQRTKVKALARRIDPGLTDADLEHVHRFPKVSGDPLFQLEAGQLRACVAARISLEARLAGGTLPTA